MHHSMRFSDRTLSYDTGLNLMQPAPKDRDLDTVGIVILPHNGALAPQGKGEEASKKISTDSGVMDQAVDDGIGTSDDETNSNSSSTTSKEGENSPNLGQPRRVIKLDLAAMSQLLTFDEEEEEDLVESEEDETDNKPNGLSSHNKEWRKTIAKDLAKLTDKSQIRRRHSITLCESRHRKSSTESTVSSISNQSSDQRSSPPKDFASLNVNAIEHQHCDFDEAPGKPLKTLDLRLEEVAHIRSVLTKAELEAMPIDSSVRDNIARGKICFHCMKAKFGLFFRGHKCEMCKQMFCHRCHTKMRIPVEHFSTTPVFALSPSLKPVESQSKRIELENSLNTTNNGRKISLPNGVAFNSSVGSAPNSPKMSAKSESSQPQSLLPTISGMVVDASAMTSLPPFMHNNNNKYATLPTKARRMSWMSTRDAQREKLEGSLLTVCLDCKEMVVQVIRVSRTSKRHSRAEFSSLSPDTVRDLRS